MKTTLGERVKLALAGPPRRTQVALAKACGVHPVSINDWVHDRTQTIEGANLLKAAGFLEVNPRWLAEGVGPMRPGNASTAFEASDRQAGTSSLTARAVIESLAAIAATQRPTLRKNLANLLVELIEHPEDAALVEQTIADVERFFTPPTA